MLTPQRMMKAQEVLGFEQANTISDYLLRWFGNRLADYIMEWLLSREPVGQPSGLISTTMVRRWLAKTLRDNRTEILAFIAVKTAEGFDTAVAAIDA